MTTAQLYSKLEMLPDSLKSEVNDFIDFLILKSKKSAKTNKPQFGSARGFYKISDDFDEPLKDFKEYM